jgi:hypothetical protein
MRPDIEKVSGIEDFAPPAVLNKIEGLVGAEYWRQSLGPGDKEIRTGRRSDFLTIV